MDKADVDCVHVLIFSSNFNFLLNSRDEFEMAASKGKEL